MIRVQATKRDRAAPGSSGRVHPGTTNTFGGTSRSEFGTSLVALAYPRPGGPSIRFNDYRRVLNDNPCRARKGDGDGGG